MLRPSVYHEIVGIFNPRATVKKHMAIKLIFSTLKKTLPKKSAEAPIYKTLHFVPKKVKVILI